MSSAHCFNFLKPQLNPDRISSLLCQVHIIVTDCTSKRQFISARLSDTEKSFIRYRKWVLTEMILIRPQFFCQSSQFVRSNYHTFFQCVKPYSHAFRMKKTHMHSLINSLHVEETLTSHDKFCRRTSCLNKFVCRRASAHFCCQKIHRRAAVTKIMQLFQTNHSSPLI